MLCRAVCRSLQRGLRAVAGRRTPVPAAALQARQMSFGIPTSGPNLAFMVLGGGSLTAALFYAYKTVHSDSQRYSNRITDLETRLKSQEEALADDPSSTAKVTIVHAVAEAEESVEPATEVASESSDPGPIITADITVAEESVTETVSETATDTPPEVREAADDLVSMAMEAAEATVAPVLEVLDTVKDLSSSVAEMAAASVGDGSSSAALVPPSGRTEERRVTLAEEVKLEQAYADVATSPEETGGLEVPSCHQCSGSHPVHAAHVEPEDSITAPNGPESALLAEHADPETSTFPDAGLDDTSHAGHVKPEDSIMYPAGLEEIMHGEHAYPEASTVPQAGLEDKTVQNDVVADSTAMQESEEGTEAEEADETTMKTTRAM